MNTNPCLEYVLETERFDEAFLDAWRVDYYEHHENPDTHDGNHEDVVEHCSICSVLYDQFLTELNAHIRREYLRK